MAFLSISDEDIGQVRAEIGLNENTTKDAVNILRTWVMQQPHLPNDIENARLERWIIRCKNSLQKAKAAIDMYYTLKNVIPDIMMDRDPQKEWFERVAAGGFHIPLPQLRHDLCRVMVLGYLDQDPSTSTMEEIAKLNLMVTEIRMLEDYCSADVYIIDMSKIKLGHVVKVTLPVLKKIELLGMRGIKIRIKEIHFVNVPSYAEVVLNLAKSVLKPKIAARLHLHSKGFESVHEFVSPKLLPVEFGGENGSIGDLWAAVQKNLLSYRDWFIEQDEKTANESKRLGKAFDSGALFGFDGSFRKLSVD